MKITRDNYESFFLDYLEGNLEENMIDQFLDFLKQNPDLKEELHLFEEIHLPVEPMVFNNKQSLYQPAESESFNHQAVAYLEGELNQQERHSFEATLQSNPTLHKQYALFEKTRLVADTTIRFPEKGRLYKKSGSLLWLNWVGRAAAVLVLLLGIYSLFHRGEDRRMPPSSTQTAAVKVPAQPLAQDSAPVVSEPALSAGEPEAQTEPKATRLQKSGIQTERPANKAPARQRELLAAELITPLSPRLENESQALALVAIHPLNTEKINDPRNILTLDEYLAYRAKKVTNEGILSANRLLRVGLNVASELSGERLGYTVKNGKVATLGFESKLLAFEIPLEKK